MNKRLTHSTVQVARLDGPARDRMFSLMERCYDGMQRERFDVDLDGKQYVILLTDIDTGELAGFSTISLRDVPHRGRTVEVLFSGDTVIHPDYWGQKALDMAFARFLLWRKVRRPWKPLYWLLLSAGYKTYLIIINYFSTAFPRRGETPAEDDQSFVDGLCRSWWGEQYDPAARVVRMSGHYHVRQGVAPIDAQALAHPDIAFFAESNAGHVHGDELVCLAEVRLSELGKAFGRIVTKRLGLRRARAPEPRPELQP